MRKTKKKITYTQIARSIDKYTEGLDFLLSNQEEITKILNARKTDPRDCAMSLLGLYDELREDARRVGFQDLTLKDIE